MNRLLLLSIAFVLLLLAYPVVSIGSMRDIEALWMSGLLALVVGGLIPPITRFTHGADEEEDADNPDQDA